MRGSLKALLEGVIDYAGLFPPAKLDMSGAVANYLSYTSGPNEWIVNRFVCPSSKLQELATILDDYPGIADLPVCVIGHTSHDLDGWDDGLERDVKALNAFARSACGKAVVEVYEVRIPSHQHVELCVRDLRSFDQMEVFVELPWGEGLEDSLAAIAQTEWLGAKARTGGLTAESFPTCSELAAFVREAVSLDLVFKLTAGLHHALPSVDSESGARMNGFLNVLAATGFAISLDLSRSEIEEILLAEATGDWRFEEHRLGWRDCELTIPQIEDCREYFEAIGSCSVDEPLNDLAALGLLAGVR